MNSGDRCALARMHVCDYKYREEHLGCPILILISQHNVSTIKKDQGSIYQTYKRNCPVYAHLRHQTKTTTNTISV